MNKNIIATVVSSVFCLSGYAANPFEVEVIRKGKLSCHNQTIYYPWGKPINCEVSGVIYRDSTLYFTTDRWEGNAGNFFSYHWDGHSPVSGVAREIKQTTINSTRKIEDLTLSHDGKYIFSTSSFGFASPQDGIWKPMNRFLYWPANNPKLAKMLNFENASNEALLRSKLLNEIKSVYPDTGYINIESIAALPDNRLIIATRQLGVSSHQNNFQSILLSISYKVSESGHLYLDGDFEFISEVDLDHPLLKQTYALSSLEYDSESRSLYALATYESPDSTSFETSIWRIRSQNYFASVLTTELATHSDGSPLLLPHKLEDFSQIRKGRYIAVADDDRAVTTSDGTRKPHEAYYYIFNFKSSDSTAGYLFRSK